MTPDRNEEEDDASFSCLDMRGIAYWDTDAFTRSDLEQPERVVS
jgi:hypothetical protein